MKKHFFRYILGIVPVVASFQVAIAQTNDSDQSPDNLISKDVVLNKKVKEASTASAATAPAAISAKAYKNFNKRYKANNEQWFTIENGSVVQFSSNDITTKVFYTTKGNWLAMVRYYQEDKLPADVRHQVKSTYYDFAITIVIEVTAQSKTAYLVKLDGKNTIKTIRVVDGEMDEYESFQKSK